MDKGFKNGPWHQGPAPCDDTFGMVSILQRNKRTGTFRGNTQPSFAQPCFHNRASST